MRRVSPKWPVEIVTDEAVTSGALLFRHRGRRALTVVVKVSFALVHGGPMLPGAPVPIVREDRTLEGSPGRSLEAATDLAPYLPRCDVLFRGYAYAQKGQAAPAGAARLAVFRDARPLLDKTLHVFARSAADGDPRRALPRAVQPGPAGGADQLFSRMPITYERAFGGPDVEANPAGSKAPHLVDPVDPRRPVGFGPIAPHWPARRRLFGARRPDPEALPDDLEWAYFQAAPPEQQIEHLRGGEWLVLDGLHPALARLQTQVPAARGAARLLRRDADGAGAPALGEAIKLVADTLFIDGDAHQCTITWRGQIPLPDGEEALSGMVVLAGLEAPDRPAPWRSLASQAVSKPRSGPEEASPRVRYNTMMLSAEQQGGVAASAPLPFSGPASQRPEGLRDRQSPPRTDATPWGPPSVRSVPVASPAAPNVTIATPIVAPPLPFVPISQVAQPPPAPEPRSPEPPSPEPPSPEPPPPTVAVAPPPLVGPIQQPFTPTPDGAAPAPAPKPVAPPPPALPRSLGKGNLGAEDVASFLKAFELPPDGAKG